MERMEGVDAGYLYMETPSMHMHTVKVAILERAGDGADQDWDIDTFGEEVLARLDRLPPFGRRVLNVPFRLNHPVWVADRPIDMSRHVVHQALPQPGGMKELEDLVGRIISVPLDRNIPLWELHLVEGLQGGRVAVVAKLHHALADGNAANNLLANVTGARGPAGPPRVLEPTPTRARLIGDAIRDFVRQLFSLPELLRRTATNVTALVRIRRGSDVTPPRPLLDVPRTSFNAALGPRRNFATTVLSLDELKAVKAKHGVTLNDVVLGVVGGALRRWMDERGELPAVSLTAGVPVGTDSPPDTAGEQVRLSGNRVSTLFTTLATDIDDPHERLAEIHRVTDASKLVQQTLGPDMLIDWVQFTPPAPFAAGMRLYSRARAASWHPAPFNVVVSNVAGPREELMLGDSRLVDLFSVGPILEGIGLNVTVWSYQDRVNVAVISCPDLVHDLEPLLAQFAPALKDLS